MDDLPEVVMVIPCFNEAARLDVPSFERALRQRSWLRLLFVNDGSSDGTQVLIERLLVAAPGQVQILRFSTNHGKAEAVRHGLLRARQHGAELLGYWDSDLSTPLEELDGMLAWLLDRDLDLVLGSRVRLLGRTIDRRPIRHICGRAFATVASFALRLPVYDTQCGAKLMRSTPGLDHILQQPFATRWIFDVEMLARLHRASGSRFLSRVAEYPLRSWRDVPGSKLEPSDILWAVLDMAALAARLRLGR